MSMDRATLTFLLTSGPSRRFDIGERTAALSQDGVSFAMFNTVFMNKAIIFKYFDDRDRTVSALQSGRFPTLVYLPYDPARPQDGGESFFYTAEGFSRFYINRSDGRPQSVERLAQDVARAGVFDQVPTLSPYLLGEAFNRAGLDVPQGFLRLPEETREKIHLRLRARLRPLVWAAFANGKRKLDTAVENLIGKMIEARDPDAILPLIDTLGLDQDTGMEAITSWTGITYFETEFFALQGQLKAMLRWLNKHSLPREGLLPAMREEYVLHARALRRNLRADWSETLAIVTEYRESYNDLLQLSQPHRFIRFLRKSKSLYWRMGEMLGRIEQICIYWQSKAQLFNFQRLPYQVLDEYYFVTRQCYRHREAAASEKAADEQWNRIIPAAAGRSDDEMELDLV